MGIEEVVRRAPLGRARALQHRRRRLRQAPARASSAMIWERFDGDRREAQLGRAAGPRQPGRERAAASTASRRGDRVAVVLPPTPETAAIFFGTWKLGAILLSMSVLYGDDGHRATGSRTREPKRARHRRGERRPLRRRRLVERCSSLDDDLLAGLRPTTSRPLDTSADDPAQLYYTSRHDRPGEGHRPRPPLHPRPRGVRLLPRGRGRRELPRHGRVGLGGRHRAAARPLAARRGPVRLPARGRLRPRTSSSTSSRRHEVTNVFTTPTAMRAMMAIERRRRALPAGVPARLLGRRAAQPGGDPLVPRAVRRHRARLLRPHRVLSARARTSRSWRSARARWAAPMPGWDVQILDEDENPGRPRRARRDLPARALQPALPARLLAQSPRPREEVFGGDWFHSKDAADAGRGRLLLVRRPRRRRDHRRRLPDRPLRGRVRLPRAPGGPRGRRGRLARRGARATSSRRSSSSPTATSPRTSSPRRSRSSSATRLSRLRLSAPDRVRRRPAEDPDRARSGGSSCASRSARNRRPRRPERRARDGGLRARRAP